MTSMSRVCALLVFVVAMAGCASAVVAPAVVTAPKFPDFILPAVVPSPDPRQAELIKQFTAGWQFLQAGDLPRAEREFQLTLKKSPEFYPSETALGYVELARSNYGPAIEQFDR